MTDVTTDHTRERERSLLREWLDYLTPLDLLDRGDDEGDVEQDVEVDLDLRYRAHRAICATEGLATCDRPASIYASQDVARYAGLDDLVGLHRAWTEPVDTHPQRTINRLRARLPRVDAPVRQVSLSEAEIDALVEWRESFDFDDDLDDAPFQTVEESTDPDPDILVDAHREMLDGRTSL